MTVTRFLQAGFESNGTGSVGVPGSEIETLVLGDGNTLTVDPTSAFTGSYGLRVKAARYNHNGVTTMPKTSELRIPLPQGTVRIRFGFWFKYKAGSHVYSQFQNTYRTRPTFFRLQTVTTTTTEIARLEWDSDDGLRPQLPGQAASVVGTKRPNIWCHFGVDFYLHATNGHFYVWEDGAPMYAYTGDTDTAANLTEIGYLVLGIETGDIGEYEIDDFYLDLVDTADPIDAPPNLRFFYQYVVGDGFHQSWLKSNPAAATHADLVDDRPHDGHTLGDTYVKAEGAGNKETFLVSPYVPQAGWKLRALIPVYYAKKAFGGDNTTFIPLLRRDGVDHALPTIDPTPFYTLKFTRLTTDPATGGDWTDTAVNAYESGMESQGDFS